MSDWRSIETAPRDGTAILALNNRVRPIWCDVIFWDDDESSSPFNWQTNDGSSGYHQDLYTHWMPLPELPESAP